MSPTLPDGSPSGGFTGAREHLAAELGRPRKALGWVTPAERLREPLVA
ncbi:hypothetical protein ACYCCF_23000 [Streptomyces argenteolus]